MSDGINWAVKRRYPRYKVSSLSLLNAKLDKTRTSERIVTLGTGGCGFYGFDQSWPLNPVKRVFSTFEMRDYLLGPITAQGNIVYIRPIEVAGKNVLYYGVEFLPFEQERIKPLIQFLEELRQQSKLKAG